MLTAHQQHKNCLNFISQLQATEQYEQFKALLFQWKEKNKTAAAGMATFTKIAQFVTDTAQDLLEEFNKCLVKQYIPPDSPASVRNIKQLAAEHPHSNIILDGVINWLKNDQHPPVTPVPIKTHQLEELSQQQFAIRLEKHERSKQIAKILYLYRRSILTVREFKSLIQPIYLTDPSLFNMLFQYAQETEMKRLKVTIFAPLNELVDQKFPMDQVGNSYILIPDGYANWSRNWNKNSLESVMNRVCVSVPLGSEVSFVITRKNQYEEQLFKNEQEKYEIDSNLQCLKAAISLIQKNHKISNPLVQRILINIYRQEIFNIMLKNQTPQIVKNIILPRLKQKMSQLLKCRAKFQKQCEDIATKNFYKSLDYRCFYFCKNDKKFNCQARWEKQIQMRKKQILHDEDHDPNLHEEIQDRQSLQKTRQYAFNSFENITKQPFIQNRKIEFNFPRKMDNVYPTYPHNQILFLVDFANLEILNDVLEIILFHTLKKNILELMIFKIFRSSIERKLMKDSSILQFIEGENMTTSNKSLQQLNEQKSKKIYRDINDEFYDLIEEDIEPTHVEDIEYPFEGPEKYTFIGTKQCYFFVRFLVTIYQRFLKAKSFSDEKQKTKSDEPSLYSQFLSILIFKFKDSKLFQQYLRKVFQQDAFIFFTLDKLIGGTSKLINNINSDSLSHKLMKQGVKDYDLQIRKWTDFVHPSSTQQLARIYKESQMLFRFTYDPDTQLMYISAWENFNGSQDDKKKKESEEHLQTNIQQFMNEIAEIVKRDKGNGKYIKPESEYFQNEQGSLVMRGQSTLVNFKRAASYHLKQADFQIKRLKKIKLL